MMERCWVTHLSETVTVASLTQSITHYTHTNTQINKFDQRL